MPPTGDDVEELTRAIRDLMMQAKKRHVEKSGDHGPTSVLFTLDKCGPTRASELARMVFLDLSTVSRHLRALEEEGQVLRDADPADGRAVQVALTDKGHALVQDYQDRRTGELREALSDWTREEVGTLTRLLDKLIRDTEGRIK
jgi:DNA-binding MarR family transcriptional regulator